MTSYPIDALGDVAAAMRKALADADKQGLSGAARDQHVVTAVQSTTRR